MGTVKPYRRIVVEYTMEQMNDENRTYPRIEPKLRRIVSWRKLSDTPLEWKILNCPQKTLYGVKGYYNTLGLPVEFYNVSQNEWHSQLPQSVNL